MKRKIDRFDIYMNYKDLNDNKVTIALGLSVGTLGKSRKEGRDLSDKVVEEILNSYIDLSRVWLLTGEGKMLKGDGTYVEPTNNNLLVKGKVIPFYDVEAAAGNNYSMDMSPVSQATKQIQIGGFLGDSESAIQVFGNSMTPNYPPGCIIGAKGWNEGFIEPGKVYIIETNENRFIKRLYYNADKTAFRCLSDNTMKHESGPATGEYCYPEFEIPLKSIRRLYRVVGVIKRSVL